jgi:hypothetical protein
MQILGLSSSKYANIRLIARLLLLGELASFSN